MILSRRSVQASYSFSDEPIGPSYTYSLYASVLHPIVHYGEEVIVMEKLLRWTRTRDKRSERGYLWPGSFGRVIYVTKEAVIEDKRFRHSDVTIRLA